MANWLQKRLNELKLTHEQFGKRLAEQGIARSRVTITNWVNDTPINLLSNPEDTKRLATALNWSVDDMLLAAGYEIDLQHIVIPPELLAYIRFYKKLNPYQKEKFLEMLDFVSGFIPRLSGENPDSKE